MPTPGLNQLANTRPMTSANVVTTSKYSSDFQPMRPTCFRSEWPAIPVTSVAKSNGAITVLII
ncbi:hypothetical protein D3C86_1931450 [compost metagenome]